MPRRNAHRPPPNLFPGYTDDPVVVPLRRLVAHFESARKAKCLGYSDLVQATGLSRDTVVRFFEMRTYPDFVTPALMAQALGIELVPTAPRQPVGPEDLSTR